MDGISSAKTTERPLYKQIVVRNLSIRKSKEKRRTHPDASQHGFIKISILEKSSRPRSIPMKNPRSRIICLESNCHILRRIRSYADDIASHGVYEVISRTTSALYDGKFVLVSKFQVRSNQPDIMRLALTP